MGACTEAFRHYKVSGSAAPCFGQVSFALCLYAWAIVQVQKVDADSDSSGSKSVQGSVHANESDDDGQPE